MVFDLVEEFIRQQHFRGPESDRPLIALDPETNLVDDPGVLGLLQNTLAQNSGYDDPHGARKIPYLRLVPLNERVLKLAT